MKRYWVDSNVFIWGSEKLYPFEGMRRYWRWFERQVEAGNIVTCKRIFREVTEGNKKWKQQAVVKWLRERQDPGLMLATSRDVQERVGDVCTKAFEVYDYSKALKFVDGADPVLIAHVLMDEEATLVTQEHKEKEYRIPRICREMGVRYIDMMEMNAELEVDLG